MAVRLGDVGRMAFQEGKLVDVDIKQWRWCTRPSTIVNIEDVGTPIPATGLARLWSFDLASLIVSKYKGLNFSDVKHKIRYVKFRKDFNNDNRPRILDRETTEAAWVQRLITKYQDWDPSTLLRQYPEAEMQHKQRMLREAIEQVRLSIESNRLYTNSYPEMGRAKG